MPTTLRPRAPAPARARPAGLARTRQEEIQGRYRPITTHQLLLAWWLYRAEHITPRQLRVYFAAHAIAETRRYADPDVRARYRIEEIQRLLTPVGEGVPLSKLSADVRKLGRLGLVKIGAHEIAFATSIDQIALEDVSSFWTSWEHLDNKNRPVPVPRRTLRALAAGFTQAQTATIVGLLIRSVFWDKQRGCINTDGRTKRSWIAAVFGISLRAVTDARAHLIEIGWLIPEQDTPQWMLNKWGSRDTINVDFDFAEETKTRAEDPCSHGDVATADEQTAASSVEEGAPSVAARSEHGDQGPEPTPGSASPPTDSAPRFASPCLNQNSSPTENLETRRLGAEAPNPAGVSVETASRRGRAKGRSTAKPNIRDIQPADFLDTDRLLELHRQAGAVGLWGRSEDSQLDFLAMAERASARGHKPGAMLMWLLREQKFAYPTQAEEDRARARLRELRERAVGEEEGSGGRRIEDFIKPRRMPGTEARGCARVLTDDEQLVEFSIRFAKQHRIQDPFRVAQKAEGWTRGRWDTAHASYVITQARQWYVDDEAIA